MTDFFPYSRQSVDEDDIAAVVSVLKSDYLTQGPQIDAFEAALAAYAGSAYAVAFSSGTAALHASYFAAGLGAGDEMITSPVTFAATSNAALMLGMKPVFVDVECDTGNINPGLIEAAINWKTKAIVPVHYAGHPVDMIAVHRIARKHDLIVIEDACHAIGAEYMRQKAKGKGQAEADEEWLKVGSCMNSDITVFSFHPVKPITTGEGGAALTNDLELCMRLKQFRTHGITKENFVNAAHGDWYYEMHYLGNNYRMTDMQAALGTSQLKKLDSFTERRRVVAARYNEAFKDNPYFDLPVERAYARSAHHLYPIRLKDAYKQSKRSVFSRMKERGLGVQVHYMPVYLQPYYSDMGFEAGACPAAEDFYEREISIPLYQGMSGPDTEQVINGVLAVFKGL